MSPPQERAEGGHPRLSVDPNPCEEQVDLTVLPGLGAERAGGKIVELASGVDALYLSGHGDVPGRLWSHLLELKAEAHQRKEAVPFSLGACDFALQGHGFGKYGIRLEHSHGLVGVTDSHELPALRFQPRAELLHGEGPMAAVEWFRQTFGPVVSNFTVSVSRADLFVDWQGWIPDPDDRLRVVTRARNRVLYEASDDLTGFQFGKRGSGLTARFYDKTEDIQRKHATYWYDVWGSRFDADKPVWRAEVEFSRLALRQFHLDGPESVLGAVGGLWKYATETWMTLRIRGDDETRSRWPKDPVWESIQGASLAGGAIGLQRARAAKAEADLEWWLPRLRGALVACGSLIQADDEAAVLAAVPRLLRTDAARSGKSFEDRLAYKRWLASLS